MTFLVSRHPIKRVQDEASTLNQMNHILNSIDCLDQIFTIQASSAPNPDGDITGEINPIYHVNSMNVLQVSSQSSYCTIHSHADLTVC